MVQSVSQVKVEWSEVSAQSPTDTDGQHQPPNIVLINN